MAEYLPLPCRSGVQRVRDAAGGPDATDGSVNGLWNWQPFRPLPALEVPQPSEGCARAQPLQLERKSHGTGRLWRRVGQLDYAQVYWAEALGWP